MTRAVVFLTEYDTTDPDTPVFVGEVGKEELNWPGLTLRDRQSLLVATDAEPQKVQEWLSEVLKLGAYADTPTLASALIVRHMNHFTELYTVRPRSAVTMDSTAVFYYRVTFVRNKYKFFLETFQTGRLTGRMDRPDDLFRVRERVEL